MAVKKHGLKMVGLREAAGRTKGLKENYSGYYIQISYNTRTGEILLNEHCSLGQNSWSVYDDSDIISVCNVSSPISMQGISNMIAEAVAERDYGY